MRLRDLPLPLMVLGKEAAELMSSRSGRARMQAGWGQKRYCTSLGKIVQFWIHVGARTQQQHGSAKRLGPSSRFADRLKFLLDSEIAWSSKQERMPVRLGGSRVHKPEACELEMYFVEKNLLACCESEQRILLPALSSQALPPPERLGLAALPPAPLPAPGGADGDADDQGDADEFSGADPPAPPPLPPPPPPLPVVDARLPPVEANVEDLPPLAHVDSDQGEHFEGVEVGEPAVMPVGESQEVAPGIPPELPGDEFGGGEVHPHEGFERAVEGCYIPEKILGVKPKMEHHYLRHRAGLRVRCTNPAHVDCQRYRALKTWVDVLGPDACAQYLACWLGASLEMTAADHQGFKPTLAQVQNFMREHGPYEA
jgi:hypothetical protein